MGLGMITALVGMVTAMCVEYLRCLPGMWPAGQYEGADIDGPVFVSRLSVFAQLPQYLLVGISQALMFVSGEVCLKVLLLILLIVVIVISFALASNDRHM